MRYGVVIMRKGNATKADDLSAALDDSPIAQRSVYVVGMDEADALDAALSCDGTIVHEPSAEQMMRYRYSETVGTEDVHSSLDGLLRQARVIAEALESKTIKRL